MQFFSQKFFLIFLFSISVLGLKAQHSGYNLIPKKDTVNIYHQMLNDKSDDLMENHPADDIYNNIWTSDKINPYKVPIDSLPDTVKVDCRNFCIPVPGMVTSDFGPRRYRYHYGTDLRLSVGDTVRAAFSGKVRIIDYEARGYGHYVVIRHDNGLETVYAHLSLVLVVLNQVVKSGQIIALGGNTGRSTGPHLHFETRYLGNAINPASIINFHTGKVHNDVYTIAKRKSFYYQREVRVQQANKYYKVRKGDTLSEIAARNGTSVKALCRLNGIKTNKKLQLGQRLRVK
ncbi:MAG: Peptidase [Bacteroidetes bacterium]|jgi:murein DD-endopeptidase MepM/ murein hydrolase activator NlpD|nr:Peptidase [Bacteroidota bacterium]